MLLQTEWIAFYVSMVSLLPPPTAVAHRRVHADWRMHVAYVLCHEKKEKEKTDFPRQVTCFELVNAVCACVWACLNLCAPLIIMYYHSERAFYLKRNSRVPCNYILSCRWDLSASNQQWRKKSWLSTQSKYISIVPNVQHLQQQQKCYRFGVPIPVQFEWKGISVFNWFHSNFEFSLRFAARLPPNVMVNMENSEDQDRKIVVEFCHLLEKSKQLFNGLRWGWLCVGRDHTAQ